MSLVPSVLDSIIVGVREDLAARSASVSHSALVAQLADVAPPRDALASLRQAQDSVAVIAEVKRRSPSKGALAEITDPAALASQYAAGGARAISVLTEERRFGGSLADLDAVRAAVDLPILRKDFIVEGYQVDEARVHGADLGLLIVAALSDSQLHDLHAHITGLDMVPLVEIHDADELERALAINPVLVGVNARNLKTLEIDPRVAHDLLPRIPAGIIAVGESGVANPADVSAYVEHGADAVLVGEALVKDGDPGRAIADFTAAARAIRENPSTTQHPRQQRPA